MDRHSAPRTASSTTGRCSLHRRGRSLHRPGRQLHRRGCSLLERIAPDVATLEDSLKPYFAGESPTQILTSVKDALRQADTTQESSRSQAPAATLHLYEAKGLLLGLIETVNRVGTLAFHGRADVIGQFNKDILLRARRAKSGKAEPVPPAPTPKLA